ncbi:MAG: hypothetical protein ACI4TG_01675 [Ruminococcus sp.]
MQDMRKLLRSYRDNIMELQDEYNKINHDDMLFQSDRIEELEENIKCVNDFVKGIYSYRIRKAIRMYYIEDYPYKLSWEQVADAIGGGWTSNALKTEIHRLITQKNCNECNECDT